jgi:hypothetical protein
MAWLDVGVAWNIGEWALCAHVATNLTSRSYGDLKLEMGKAKSLREIV